MEYKPVHFHIYDPSGVNLFKTSKNEKAKCFVIECNNSNNCELHAKGMCAMASPLGWHRCPYGKFNNTEGYSQRAKYFRKWINDKKEQYEGVPYLKSHEENIYSVGEYMFMPYPHIEMNESVPFLGKSGFMLKGNAFLPDSAFNKEIIKNILQFRPYAVLGGEIESYQKKSVPKIARHLFEKYPDLFAEVSVDFPGMKKTVESLTNIGRKAIVNTLRPGCKLTKRDESWIWDGEKLMSEKYKALFPIVNYVGFEATIIPTANALFVIQSEDQVGDSTIFVN
jgi:ribosomal protein S17E